MRAFLIFAVIAGFGGLYFWQKQHEAPASNSNHIATAPAQKSSPPAELTPAPRGQASEHNWMKRSLDRAATVRDEARAQTNAAQKP